MKPSIIQAGAIYITLMFTVLVLYLFIASPFEEVIVGFEDINETVSDAKIENSGTMVRVVFNMIFGIAFLIPTIWFIVWVFSREDDWRFER